MNYFNNMKYEMLSLWRQIPNTSHNVSYIILYYLFGILAVLKTMMFATCVLTHSSHTTVSKGLRFTQSSVKEKGKKGRCSVMCDHNDTERTRTNALLPRLVLFRVYVVVIFSFFFL